MLGLPEVGERENEASPPDWKEEKGQKVLFRGGNRAPLPGAGLLVRFPEANGNVCVSREAGPRP